MNVNLPEKLLFLFLEIINIYPCLQLQFTWNVHVNVRKKSLFFLEIINIYPCLQLQFTWKIEHFEQDNVLILGNSYGSF